MTSPRLLYVEGPDGAGKTTYISEREGRYDIKWHNGPYATLDIGWDAFSGQVKYLETNPTYSGVLDRSIFSNQIYGKVLRDNEIQPVERVDDLMKRMRDIGTILVVCLPPYDTALNNWKKNIKNELVQDEEKYKQIYRMYEDLTHNLYLPTLIWDYTTGDHHVTKF